MSHVKFVCDIFVEGKAYKTNEVVAKTEIPKGSLESLMNTRRVVECQAESSPAKKPQ
jgi:hypothetical protein